MVEEMSIEEVRQKLSETQGIIQGLQERTEELEKEVSVENKLYWLEYGTNRWAINEEDYLIDKLHNLQEEDPDAEVVLWELTRTAEQMKAGDMRVRLPELMTRGIARAQEKRLVEQQNRAREQVKKLLEANLDIDTIASVVGLTGEEVKVVKKEQESEVTKDE